MTKSTNTSNNKLSQHHSSITNPVNKLLQTTTLLTALTAAITLAALPLSLAKKAIAETKSAAKTISLIAKDGSKLNIGELILTKTDAGHSFKINFDAPKFSEHFLSMRPFKCIDGPQTFCHLIYPYKTKNLITPTDTMDLEYALLFIHKAEKEYGINFWNGVYYRITQNDDGSFSGSVWETDMNELASPPENEYDRPIGNDDLVEAAEGKHRFPRLEIK